jgi:uncharacterized membrane protein (DUF485 family)
LVAEAGAIFPQFRRKKTYFAVRVTIFAFILLNIYVKFKPLTAFLKPDPSS